MNGKFKVGTATYPFIDLFKQTYKDIEVVKNVDDYDLIIFTGGEDISPKIYGQENTYSSINVKRDITELNILAGAMRLNKKILGVCRGHQLINAFLGGSLVQDLRIELNSIHRGYHKLDYTDDDSIVKDSFLTNSVNSMHHQGVVIPGKSLRVTSTHNKVIESTESKNIISVQFHPEFMSKEGSEAFFENINNWVIGN